MFTIWYSHHNVVAGLSNQRQRHKSFTITPGHFANKQQSGSASPVLSNKLVPADSEAMEVWYCTVEGVVGVADLQQSSTSSQVISYGITTC